VSIRGRLNRAARAAAKAFPKPCRATSLLDDIDRLAAFYRRAGEVGLDAAAAGAGLSAGELEGSRVEQRWLDERLPGVFGRAAAREAGRETDGGA
jgi:hypothetical protein